MRLRPFGTIGGGYILTASSLATGALGFLFWLIAATRFAASDVGFAAAVIAAITVILGCGSLGMSSAFLRYVPRVGGAWGQLVLRGYLVAAAGAGVLAFAFALGAGINGGSLSALASPNWVALLVVTGVLGVVFTLEDSVLIPLRRPGLVFVENVTVSIARIAFLFVGPVADARAIMVLAWLIPSVLAVVLINSFLFMLARIARVRDAASARPATGIVRFCVQSTFGIIATSVMIGLMPVIVTALDGPGANAHFFLPWGIYTTLQLVGSSMSAPLTAEIARGLTDEGRETIRVLRHALGVVAILAAISFVVAPFAFGLLGKNYRTDLGLFALLMIAVCVGVVGSVLLGRERSHGRAGLTTAIQWAGVTVMIVGAVVGINAIGVVGVGWAVLAAQVTMTALAIAAYRLRPPADSPLRAAAQSRMAQPTAP